MSLWDIKVNIDWRKLHVILILERVWCIARKARKIDSVAFGARRDGKRLVVCIPRVVLQILEDYPQLCAIVACQMMQHFISNPQLSVGISESISIFFPRSIEIHRTVFSLLNDCPGTHTFRHHRASLIRRRNQVQAIVFWWIYLGTVAWERFNNVLILHLNTFKLFKKLRCRVYSISRWTRIPVGGVAFSFWLELWMETREMKKKEWKFNYDYDMTGFSLPAFCVFLFIFPRLVLCLFCVWSFRRIWETAVGLLKKKNLLYFFLSLAFPSLLRLDSERKNFHRNELCSLEVHYFINLAWFLWLLCWWIKKYCRDDSIYEGKISLKSFYYWRKKIVWWKILMEFESSIEINPRNFIESSF